MFKKVLIVVDYQKDFASPNGALYVPGAEAIYKRIQKEIDSGKYDYIVYTMDSHVSVVYSKSEEAKMFPPHCIYGTEGWEFYNIIPRNKDLINKMKNNKTPTDVSIGNEFVFVKDRFDVWDGNDNYEDFIKEFDKDTEFVICGVATNYCVFSNAMGYKNIGYKKVSIIEEAVRGIQDESFDTNINIMKENGIVFIGGTQNV